MLTFGCLLRTNLRTQTFFLHHAIRRFDRYYFRPPILIGRGSHIVASRYILLELRGQLFLGRHRTISASLYLECARKVPCFCFLRRSRFHHRMHLLLDRIWVFARKILRTSEEGNPDSKPNVGTESFRWDLTCLVDSLNEEHYLKFLFRAQCHQKDRSRRCCKVHLYTSEFCIALIVASVAVIDCPHKRTS